MLLLAGDKLQGPQAGCCCPVLCRPVQSSFTHTGSCCAPPHSTATILEEDSWAGPPSQLQQQKPGVEVENKSDRVGGALGLELLRPSSSARPLPRLLKRSEPQACKQEPPGFGGPRWPSQPTSRAQARPRRLPDRQPLRAHDYPCWLIKLARGCALCANACVLARGMSNSRGFCLGSCSAWVWHGQHRFPSPHCTYFWVYVGRQLGALAATSGPPNELEADLLKQAGRPKHGRRSLGSCGSAACEPDRAGWLWSTVHCPG